jgi:hypothetical protein
VALGISALDQDQINDLLGKVSKRGEYDRQLASFLESGEPGIEVSLVEGPFSERKAQSVKTGFESATKRDTAPEGSANVQVMVHDDRVYLIRRDVAA